MLRFIDDWYYKIYIQVKITLSEKTISTIILHKMEPSQIYQSYHLYYGSSLQTTIHTEQ